MKRGFIILAPPLVFALTAAVAFSIGIPAENARESANIHSRSSRQRAAVGADSGDVSAALLQSEKKILPHNPAPPVKIHAAQGMEDSLFSDEGTSFFPGGGMRALHYAIEWAEDAPEEMFAWLSQQSDKRSFYAYILFGAWAEKDKESALAAAFKLSDAKLRVQALMSSLEVVCKSDPDRARDLLLQNMSLIPPKGEGLIFSSIDPGKPIWDLLACLPPGEERTHLQARLLNSMDSEEQARIVWKQATETQRREWVDAGFAPYMTDAEAFESLGEMMRERAETSADPEVVESFIEGHGEAWAKRDLAGALDWAQAHLKGRKRVEWREKFFQAGIAEDFNATLRVWQELPEGYQKRRVADAIRRAVPEARKAEAEAILPPQDR